MTLGRILDLSGLEPQEAAMKVHPRRSGCSRGDRKDRRQPTSPDRETFAGAAHNRDALLRNQGVPAVFIRSGGIASLRRRGAKCSVRIGPRMEVVTISTRTTL